MPTNRGAAHHRAPPGPLSPPYREHEQQYKHPCSTQTIHCPGQAIAGAQRGGGSLGQGAMCPFTRGQLARSQEPYFQSQILLVSVSTRGAPLKT